MASTPSPDDLASNHPDAVHPADEPPPVETMLARSAYPPEFIPEDEESEAEWAGESPAVVARQATVYVSRSRNPHVAPMLDLTLADGEFQASLVDVASPVFGIRSVEHGWFDFGAGTYSREPYDPARHSRPTVPDPDVANAILMIIPAAPHEHGPFTVYAFKDENAPPKAVASLDYGVKGYPWGFPDTFQAVVKVG